jgi:hypothetical protein
LPTAESSSAGMQFENVAGISFIFSFTGRYRHEGSILSGHTLMRKLQLIGFINHFIGNPESYSLENRIFNAVMILVSVTGGVATTYNIILNNHIILTACSSLSAILTFLAYGFSWKTRKYRPLVTPVILYFFVIMIVSWLANDGTKGAGADFFFILMSAGVLLLKRPFPKFMLAIVITLVGLLMVEFLYPSFLIGYKTRTQQFLDVGISLILCLVFNGMIIHIVFREYLRERQLKDTLLAQTIRDKEELEKAQKEIKILKGIIPICAGCKMIRDKEGNWNHFEEYLNEHSEAKLSHGICPDCVSRLYPELSIKVN